MIMGIMFPLKIVTITLDLLVSTEQCDIGSKESIAALLNKQLHDAPESLGNIVPDNIVLVRDVPE